MSKSILFIPTNIWAPWGGSEKLWAEAAKHLVNVVGVSVTVSIKKWPSIPKVLGDLLYNTAVLERPEPTSIADRVAASIQRSALKQDRNRNFFDHAVQKSKPQLVVIAQAANVDGLIWMEYCVESGLPFVTISQAASPASWPSPEMAVRLSNCFSKAQVNFFVSNANKQLTELQIGSRLSNAEVIFNPFNVPFHPEISYPRVVDDYFFACVARLELHAKGQDVLCEVMSDPKWMKRNVKIGLFGEGVDRENIDRIIKMMGLEGRVILHGQVDPLTIWKTHHLLVLPSRYEGSPLALIEAMLCSRPAVVTDAGGNRELIHDKVDGFVAAAPTACSIDEALEQAWQNRKEWETMGKQARKNISAKISPDPSSEFAGRLAKILTRDLSVHDRSNDKF
jgi:glycosyltransferase involved in cell wall biosynthesis